MKRLFAFIFIASLMVFKAEAFCNLADTSALKQKRFDYLFRAKPETGIAHFLNDTSKLKYIKHDLLFNSDSSKFIGFYEAPSIWAMDDSGYFEVFAGVKYKGKWYSGMMFQDKVPYVSFYGSTMMSKDLVYQYLLKHGIYKNDDIDVNPAFWSTYLKNVDENWTDEQYKAQGFDVSNPKTRKVVTDANGNMLEKEMIDTAFINYYKHIKIRNQKYLGFPELIAWELIEKEKEQKRQLWDSLATNISDEQKLPALLPQFFNAEMPVIYPQNKSKYLIAYSNAAGKTRFALLEKTSTKKFEVYSTENTASIIKLLQKANWASSMEYLDDQDFWKELLRKNEDGGYSRFWKQ